MPRRKGSGQLHHIKETGVCDRLWKRQAKKENRTVLMRTTAPGRAPVTQYDITKPVVPKHAALHQQLLRAEEEEGAWGRDAIEKK